MIKSIKLTRYGEGEVKVTVNKEELRMLEELVNQLVEIRQLQEDAKEKTPIARHTYERLMQVIGIHEDEDVRSFDHIDNTCAPQVIISHV